MNPFAKIRKSPESLLLLFAFIMPLTFSVWHALLNNFTVEQALFTGQQIGLLQSLREVPGFLAFTSVFMLLLFREQIFAYISLVLMCIGVALTGFWPQEMPLYITTIIMSTGFHYFETVNQSLTLQWLDKSKSASFMGRAMAVKSVAALLAYGGIWLLMDQLNVGYQFMYLLAGCVGLVVVFFMITAFPRFDQKTTQHNLFLTHRGPARKLFSAPDWSLIRRPDWVVFPLQSILFCSAEKLLPRFILV